MFQIQGLRHPFYAVSPTHIAISVNKKFSTIIVMFFKVAVTKCKREKNLWQMWLLCVYFHTSKFFFCFLGFVSKHILSYGQSKSFYQVLKLLGNYFLNPVLGDDISIFNVSQYRASYKWEIFRWSLNTVETKTKAGKDDLTIN